MKAVFFVVKVWRGVLFKVWCSDGRKPAAPDDGRAQSRERMVNLQPFTLERRPQHAQFSRRRAPYCGFSSVGKWGKLSRFS
jgi:hypothetical protein